MIFKKTFYLFLNKLKNCKYFNIYIKIMGLYQIQEWLREIKGINIEIYYNGHSFQYDLIDMYDQYAVFDLSNNKEFNNYNDCLMAAITYCINNVN